MCLCLYKSLLNISGCFCILLVQSFYSADSVIVYWLSTLTFKSSIYFSAIVFNTNVCNAFSGSLGLSPSCCRSAGLIKVELLGVFQQDPQGKNQSCRYNPNPTVESHFYLEIRAGLEPVSEPLSTPNIKLLSISSITGVSSVMNLDQIETMVLRLVQKQCINCASCQMHQSCWIWAILITGTWGKSLQPVICLVILHACKYGNSDDILYITVC